MAWSAWRQSVVWGVAGIMAVLATVAFAMLRPPSFSSTVLVSVPTAASMDTQALIASSDMVLGPASRADPVLTLGQLNRQVTVVPAAATSLAITVSASTAAAAQSAANAVARSYVSLLWSLPRSPSARMRAYPSPATPATGRTMSAWVVQTAGFGTLVGIVLGAIAAVALVRPRQRAN